jgi:ApaG protein
MPFKPDIEIEVQTAYLRQESQPANARFVFSYTITITNNSNEPIKLLTRHWHICDANEKVQDVHGEGVVGQKPRLITGQSFQYSSGAILETPFGTMEGNYEFISDSGDIFKAPIPAFTLADPTMLH